ncbi:hypothetical protein [Microbacterium sp. SORGH_AS_0888]|uniref:hypothetical protein n=1 Tax=Microbacterium sp. SORGH_AS_0888 TaxID=3041791 RepID=UPI0027871DB4|nr:hypothetical protein [Microbacterium sp. SORGH_AS_0888]MDQ1130260.1 hypothetical protein [Microbacterium sp. SORGH_AS_0888]
MREVEGNDPSAASDGSAHPITEAEVREFETAKNHAQELETSPADPAPDQTARLEDQVPGIRFLASLLKATIFTDLFVYHAVKRYVHPTEQERIDALIVVHPKFYKLCRNSDYIARVLLSAVVTFLVSAAAWGTIARLFFA